MEEKINLSPLHCIFFIYQSFAFATDGKLSNEEKTVISKFMYRWTGKKQDALNQIITETLSWGQQHVKTTKDQVEIMMSMLTYLKKQPNFTLPQREYFLMDIRNIARSDGTFLDQQKNWHDMMANLLEVEIRVSPQTHEQIQQSLNKIKKKKIGFRRSK